MKITLSICSFIFLFISCKNTSDSTTDKDLAIQESREPVEMPAVDGLERAYFASGCFWCVEAVYENVKGVDHAVSGYSGGSEQDPTYKQVSSGNTGHAEAVEVFYDPSVISFQTLVDVFFGSQDPTTKNSQGPDHGTQYRSIAFYQNQEQKDIIENTIEKLNESTYSGNITTQVLPFQKFWPAEDYHQDYERNHRDNPYIKGVSIPRLNRFKAKFPDLLKDNQGTH